MEHKDNRAQGILFIMMAAFCFALMNMFVRLSGDLPTMEKAFFRNAVAAIAAFFILMRTEEKFKIHKGSWPYLLLRSGFGTVGILCNFYCVDKMNIADASMLNKMSPFFAVILSAILLKEKADKVEYGAVIVAFLGALFIIKPSFQMQAVYGLLGMLGGFGAGVAYTMVRKLGKMGERGPLIVLFFSVFSSLVTLPGLILNYQPMSGKQLFFLIMAGVAATGGQIGITTAYTKAPAKEISVFDYSQILFAALLSSVFLGQIPDYLSVIGYVIIIGVAVFKWNYGLRKDQKLAEQK